MTYDSVARCASANGYERKLLLKAKSMGCPGFRNSKVYWNDVEPWVKQHLDELATIKIDDDDSLAMVKLENLKKDGKLKDLEIKKKEESLLTVEDAQNLLESLATAQMGLFSRIQKELPLKISGKQAGDIELELQKAFKEIIDILHCDLSKWV